MSLQIFWQTFYRNVPWVVLYETYHFWHNLWIWYGYHDNRKAKFEKKILKNHLLRGHKGDKAETLQNVHNISPYKNGIFIPIAHVLSLQWQLKFSIDLLQWDKWKLAFHYYYLIADILTKKIQKYLLSGPPSNIYFVSKPLNFNRCHGNPQKAKFLKKKKYLKINSSEAIIMGDIAETLQKCS